jgi:ferric-dicitrate binding protein FerR (iron transport regulator)
MGKRFEGTDPSKGIGRNSPDERVSGESTPDATHARSTVDDLIIKVFHGTASPFEEERLKRWREETPDNEEYYHEMMQVWNLTSPEAVIPTSGPPDVKEILAAAPIPFEPKRVSSPIQPGRKPSAWLKWGLLAASVAAVGLGIQYVGIGEPQAVAVHEVSSDENLTVTLNDGSFVRLAAGSTLREWDVEGRREVSLEGRGFFAVTRDETRPFVVRAGPGEVRVLGTRFQVDATENEVATVVVEGLVRVSTADGSVEVSAGNMARMKHGESPLAEEVDDVFAFMDWPNGILVYQATPLAQVVEEVSRHYGRALRIEGPNLAQRRVTAWFQGEPFEAVAESLCIVTEAVCRPEGEGVTMETGGNEGPE